MNEYADLIRSTFARVVRHRQAHVAAVRHVDALLDSDPCDRRCKCSIQGEISSAKAVERSAYANLRIAEASYSELCAAR
jgi:hypothetical protein